MKFAVVRLAVAAVLFVGWIGYLGFLAATVRNPFVLSRPQFLVSERDMIATFKGGDKFVIDEVLSPKGASESEKGKTLIVGNLKDCQIYSPQDDKFHFVQTPEGKRYLVEGQRYLLPLQTTAGPDAARLVFGASAWGLLGSAQGQAPLLAASALIRNRIDAMDVVPIPTLSAGAGPPRIYPDTAEVQQQYQTIKP